MARSPPSRRKKRTIRSSELAAGRFVWSSAFTRLGNRLKAELQTSKLPIRTGTAPHEKVRISGAECFRVDIHIFAMYSVPMIRKELVAASAEPLILSLLVRGESYGYAIIQEVKARSDGDRKGVV